MAIKKPTTKSSDLATVEKTGSPLALIKEATKSVTAGLQTMAALLSRDLPPGTAVSIYHLIDKEWKKPIEDMREFARKGLLDFLEEHGDNELEYAGSKYQAKRQITRHSMPDETALRELLESRGKSISEVQMKVISYEIDMGKVEQFIKQGVLTAEELDGLRKTKSVSLKVEKI
jgi:hypothetical protein